MRSLVATNRGMVVIGIAIKTLMSASVVRSDIYACYAPAFESLRLIFLCGKSKAGYLFYKLVIDTLPMAYTTR